MNILITGASGGIGSSFLKYILENLPDSIIGACCNKNYHIVEKILEQYPTRVMPLVFDATDPLQVSCSIDKFVFEVSKIDLLINCIGSSATPQFLIHANPFLVKEVIETNLVSSIWCCQQVLKNMVKEKGGRIVNISSIVGVQPSAGVSAYATSKGAIESFTMCIAEEYKKRNVSAYCLRLGLVNSGMGLQVNSSVGIPMLSVDEVCKKLLFLINTNFLDFPSGSIIEMVANN